MFIVYVILTEGRGVVSGPWRSRRSSEMLPTECVWMIPGTENDLRP